ncbi:group II truncated hemoglobin [Endozoicomonas numazuensis]|uniref:Globin n=1 Tax=Endozoicomonas numazuensis TaxID=1137799 RepID=A0A081NE66_9GAMM|nr:group II truncated hemoglobin [Endozoicomonas numazuensis]KEQ16739.1 globin [Endozoicomonas numazuensis]
MSNSSPYELLGGEEKIRALAKAFYQAMDKTTEAEEIRQMHAKSLDQVEQRLFEYLSGWLGGPGLYHEKHGTVCLTSPHKPYQINADHRDQWLLCMDKALEEIGASTQVKSMLKEPMFRLADFIKNV